MGLALVLAAPVPSCAAVEEGAEPDNESTEEGMIQERANGLSRFESSRVEMRHKDTLVVVVSDGSKEFFKRVEQTMRGPANRTHQPPANARTWSVFLSVADVVRLCSRWYY